MATTIDRRDSLAELRAMVEELERSVGIVRPPHDLRVVDGLGEGSAPETRPELRLVHGGRDA